MRMFGKGRSEREKERAGLEEGKEKLEKGYTEVLGFIFATFL